MKIIKNDSINLGRVMSTSLLKKQSIILILLFVLSSSIFPLPSLLSEQTSTLSNNDNTRDDTFDLHVLFVGNGSGVVYYSYDATPGKLNSTGNISDIPAGTEVFLEAIPDLGHQFTGWMGDIIDTDSSVSIVMTENMTVKVAFVAVSQTFDVTFTWQGINGSSGFIDYEKVKVQKNDTGRLTPPYDNLPNLAYGQELVLEAVPNAISNFSTWNGDIISSKNPININVTSDLSIEVVFEKGSTYSINISLYKGYNWITYYSPYSMNASSVFDNISGCVYVGVINHNLSPPSQYYFEGGDDFVIQPGMGIEVYVSENSSLLMSEIPVDLNISVQMCNGYNWIGWIRAYEITASSVFDNISGCVYVGVINHNLSPPSQYYFEGGDDFVIQPGMGIEVYVSENSTWYADF